MTYYVIIMRLIRTLTSKKREYFFEKLFQPYQNRKNIIGQYRGRQEIRRKTDRVIKIYKWLQHHWGGSFGGVSCFIVR